MNTRSYSHSSFVSTNSTYKESAPAGGSGMSDDFLDSMVNSLSAPTKSSKKSKPKKSNTMIKTSTYKTSTYKSKHHYNSDGGEDHENHYENEDGGNDDDGNHEEEGVTMQDEENDQPAEEKTNVMQVEEMEKPAPVPVKRLGYYILFKYKERSYLLYYVEVLVFQQIYGFLLFKVVLLCFSS